MQTSEQCASASCRMLPVLCVLTVGVMLTSNAAGVDGISRILKDHKHIHSVYENIFDVFLDDIMTPCSYEHGTEGTIQELLERVKEVRLSDKVNNLIELYNNRPITEVAEEYVLMPSHESSILSRYNDLSVLAYMLRITAIQEGLRYGDIRGFQEHYQQIYQSIIKILCSFKRWLSTKGLEPDPREITRGVINAMRRKFSLASDQHIQEGEEMLRLMALKESLLNLHLYLTLEKQAN